MPMLASGIAATPLGNAVMAGRVAMVSAILSNAPGPSPDASVALLIRDAPFMTIRRSVSGRRDAALRNLPA